MLRFWPWCWHSSSGGRGEEVVECTSHLQRKCFLGDRTQDLACCRHPHQDHYHFLRPSWIAWCMAWYPVIVQQLGALGIIYLSLSRSALDATVLYHSVFTNHKFVQLFNVCHIHQHLLNGTCLSLVCLGIGMKSIDGVAIPFSLACWLDDHRCVGGDAAKQVGFGQNWYTYSTKKASKHHHRRKRKLGKQNGDAGKHFHPQ